MRGRLLVASLAVALVFAALAVALAASHRQGLDRSYGKHGIARLFAPQEVKEDGEKVALAYIDARAFAAADDGSAYVIVKLGGCRSRCRNGDFVYRFDRRGKLDRSFGGDGIVPLPKLGYALGVATDRLGRPVVAAVLDGDVVVRRLSRAGRPDGSFGRAGSLRLDCNCAGYQLRVLRAPRGRTVVDVNVPLSGRDESVRAFRARIYRLGPDGRPDQSFGGSGSIVTKIRHPELPASVVIGSDGSILLGGSKCCGPREVYVERIAADGKLDRGFERIASSSVRRLNTLGEFPTLAAALPRRDGGVDLVGTSQARHGFYLRLRSDGRLASGFGRRGLARLPFIVSTATRGRDGAIFAAGEARPSYGYDAFRILADGRPDPAYHGGHGIEIPLGGLRIHVAAAGRGWALVFDNGNSFCRSGCAAEPALARFLE